MFVLTAHLFRSLWLVLLLGLGASAAWAQVPPLLLQNSQPALDAWPALTLLADPGRSLTLDEVRARRAQFQPPATPTANLGPRREAVWLRLPLRVADGDGRWLLDIDYPPLNQVDVYLLARGQLLQHWRLGSSLPYAQRPLPTRNHVAPLALQPGAEYELYLRVQTDSSMVLPIHLSQPAHYYAEEAKTLLVQGVLAGVALALVVYSVAHWASLGNAMFGLYALMVCGSGMFFLAYFGLAQQYLFETQAGLAAKLAPLSVLAALAGAGHFIAAAVDTRTHKPGLHLGLRLLSTLAAVALGASMLGWLDYRTTQLAPTVLGPALALFSVPAAWAHMRRGHRAGLYLLLGWSTYMAGALTMAGLLRGWLPANTWTQHLFQAGWLVEMMAWLRVLGLHIEAVRRDAERTEVERRSFEQLACTDALTGLPNRRGLNLALAQALDSCRAEQALAVFLLDLDGFKAVNDRLGHDAGDALLVQVSLRLKAQMRQRDVVARLGGDEFVIVAEALAGEAQAQRIGRKLLAAFDEPFLVAGQPCHVGLTIGFALAPHDGRDAADLLKRADAAMYAGKQAGRHTLRRGAASYGLA